MVYNLAAAYKLGLHRLTQSQWEERLRKLTGSKKPEQIKEELPTPAKVVSNVPRPILQSRGKSMMGSLRERLGR